jgi:hypothetical protein
MLAVFLAASPDEKYPQFVNPQSRNVALKMPSEKT